MFRVQISAQVSLRPGHMACTRERREILGVSAGKSEGKATLERFRRKWKDNILMDLKDQYMRDYGLDSPC
jgi:hypothetical protein